MWINFLKRKWARFYVCVCVRLLLVSKRLINYDAPSLTSGCLDSCVGFARCDSRLVAILWCYKICLKLPLAFSQNTGRLWQKFLLKWLFSLIDDDDDDDDDRASGKCQYLQRAFTFSLESFLYLLWAALYSTHSSRATIDCSFRDNYLCSRYATTERERENFY